jgi:pyruvate, water dikinase
MAMFDLRKLFKRKSKDDDVDALRARVEAFRDLLHNNNHVLELMGDAEQKLGGEYLFDGQYLKTLDRDLAASVEGVVQNLRRVAPGKHEELGEALVRIREAVSASLESRPASSPGPVCRELSRIGTEHAGVVGEKLARLGEVRQRLELPVPDGFVITSSAFSEAFRRDDITTLARQGMEPDADPAAISRALMAAVMSTRLPSAVAKCIKRSLARFGRHARFAVRSSAVGEDGHLSFAGLHHTELNVSRADVPAAYLRVVASLFAEGPIRYRRDHDEPLEHATMAVGVMLMVPAVAAGVAYSLDPNRPKGETLLIDAAWGLGTAVVQGSGASDQFTLSRCPPHEVLARSIGRKHSRHIADDAGGTRVADVTPGDREKECVPDEVLAQVASNVLRIERHMRCPQDVEWAVDESGKVWILQARPLRMGPGELFRSEELQHALDSHDVLLRGRGVVACRGIGAGKVVAVSPGTKHADVPSGSVLLTRFPSPALSALIPSASAMVTDEGSTTGHLATMAREHRVPTIMNTAAATSTLLPGMEVTVDAEENIIYAGTVDALVRYDLLQSDQYSETKEFRVLRAMMANIAPLHLRDRTSSEFTAKACTTYHDVIRFAHESALAALSALSEVNVGYSGRHLRSLKLAIPLDLILLDLGGGVNEDDESEKGRVVTLEQVGCRPLRLLLDALTAPGVWATSPTDMDLAGFMASATRSMALTTPGSVEVDRNLAIVSAGYLNLSLRLGYHFNVIDCYLGEGQEDSHLRFRFVGGVTEMARRKRRAALLCEILSHYDFAVERSGDLAIARLNAASREVVEQRLADIGRLVGYTRQLDILLRDEETTSRLVEKFLAGGCSPHEGGTTEGKMAESTKVLVLDDEATVGERLKDFLGKNGMEVEAFVDSRAAIARLNEAQFDVVVTDLKMQGPSGLDVLVHVKQKATPTEVIIITAFANVEDAHGAQFAGAFDFITKPFRMSDMLKLVKKAAKKAGRNAD